MRRFLNWAAIALAALGLAAVDGAAYAQGKGKDKEHKEQGAKPDKDQGGKPDKEKKQKQHKHHDGKSLVGEKVKKDGKHEFHKNGKKTAFIQAKGGKIAGVTVTDAEKGNVPVKKYKTNKKMAELTDGAGSIKPVSLVLTQAGTQYLGTTYIGYSYIDDWGDEVIYWFPYDMILDGDTGAVEYVPAY